MNRSVTFPVQDPTFWLSRLPLKAMTIQDATPLQCYFEKKIAAGYADTWTYMAQAINGRALNLNDLGYLHCDTQCVVGVGIFSRPADRKLCFHLVNAMGQNAVAGTISLARKIAVECNTPIYLKKCDLDAETSFLDSGSWVDAEKYPWHPDAPAEDDTFPEVLISIQESLKLAEQHTELRDKVRRFVRRQKTSGLVWRRLVPEMHGAAEELFNEFFMSRSGKQSFGSSANDYRNMIAFPSKRKREEVIAELLLINDRPVALLIAERIALSDTLGLYCNLALHQVFPYLSEYVIHRLLEIARGLGYMHINMGGSETADLDKFKTKFHPVRKIQKSWLLYDRNQQS